MNSIRDIEKFNTLLQDFSQLKLAEPTKESFLSICGFPHYERVISNILSFFFDSTREHGLNQLFIQSLYDLVSELQNIDFDVSLDFHSYTEVRTEKGNFIDILIQSDEISIVVENKIYAQVNNDLNDYYNFTKSKNKRNTVGILLSLYEIESPDSHFISITYEQFIDKVKSNLGKYICLGDSRYAIFLFDFIENIENLTGHNNMNTEFLDFLSNNLQVVESFEDEMNKLRNEMRKVVREVNNLVKEQFDLPKEILYFWEWRDNKEFFDTAVCDYSKDSYKFTIDSTFNKNGWSFSVFSRNDQTVQQSKEFCKTLGKDYSGEIGDRYRLKKNFPIDEDKNVVAGFICKLINKLIEK